MISKKTYPVSATLAILNPLAMMAVQQNLGMYVTTTVRASDWDVLTSSQSER